MRDGEKQKVKFLTAVWGESYISRFCDLSLPSFVAPGNIPALAEGRDFEVVIMTRDDDFACFDGFLAMVRLRAICPVRFVAIDDLMGSSVYGVTLTLAYARPIIDMGEEALNTQFVFMNADFILADGSLRSLADQIDSGHEVILGPSFRAVSEDVEPVLAENVDPVTGVLCMSSRPMVRLAIHAMHPTTVAKIQNQNFLRTSHPNQMFWQVDAETIIGHYFLVFMLSIKPRRIIGAVSSYCDYSFIHDLCPSAKQVIMGDSDEFFMLELQELTKEATLLNCGAPMDAKQTALALSKWAIEEHLSGARLGVVFHSADIPPEAATVQRAARKFTQDVLNIVRITNMRFNHWHWIYGIEAWLADRALAGEHRRPPELSAQTIGLRLLFYRGKAALRAVFMAGGSWAKKSVFISPEAKLAKRLAAELCTKNVDAWVATGGPATPASHVLKMEFPSARFQPVADFFKKHNNKSFAHHEQPSTAAFVFSAENKSLPELITSLTEASCLGPHSKMWIYSLGDVDAVNLYQVVLKARHGGFIVSIESVGNIYAFAANRLKLAGVGWPLAILRWMLFPVRALLLFCSAWIPGQNRPVDGLQPGTQAILVHLRRQ